MTLDEAAAREMADVEYLDDSRGEIVYVADEDVLHRKNVDVGIDEDSIQPSDRCPQCTAIVTCERCLNTLEDARDLGIEAVDLNKERRLTA